MMSVAHESVMSETIVWAAVIWKVDSEKLRDQNEGIVSKQLSRQGYA